MSTFIMAPEPRVRTGLQQSETRAQRTRTCVGDWKPVAAHHTGRRFEMRTFHKCLALAAVAWLASMTTAEVSAEANQQAERTSQDQGRQPVRIGAIAGVGFPHPMAVEAMVKLGDIVAIGAEYGVLPTVNVDGVETNLWSLSGDVRLFPFRNAFFIGVRGGHQHLGAQSTVTAGAYGSATEALGMDSWFVNPQLGLLWTSASGLTLGIAAGVQIPLSSSITSSLPLALAPGAQQSADTLGGTWLPTVDLLRIGLLL